MQPALDQSEQVPAALASLRDSLGSSLCAVYLHGSAVSGRLQPQSDIDLLAVTNRQMTQSERGTLLSSLLKLSGRHPAEPEGPRCLEVMVFTLSDFADRLFPARADFIYGEWLRDAFEAGDTPMPAQNAEFTLVLAQAQQEAVALIGPDRESLLPAIPMIEIRSAMRELLPDLLVGLPEDTRNVLLTLARIWYTAKNGAFISKDEAANWAVPQLSLRSAMMLDHAKRAYLGEVGDDWSRRQNEVQDLVAELTLNVNKALMD